MISAVSPDTKRQRFRELHESGIFVMPNPWDAGSARILQQLGFEALATTSSGFAATLGRSDQQVTLPELVTHVAAIAASVDIPVNVDAEYGYAVAPAGIAGTVAQLAQAGAAGLSIEDYDPQAARVVPMEAATERVEVAAAACARAGLVLTARAENHLYGNDDLDDTIARLQAYRAAGADVVYAPGLTSIAAIARVVQETGAPVNVLAMRAGPSVPELKAVGVRRVSTGGSLTWAAYGGLVHAARELREHGTSTYLDAAITPGLLAAAGLGTDRVRVAARASAAPLLGLVLTYAGFILTPAGRRFDALALHGRWSAGPRVRRVDLAFLDLISAGTITAVLGVLLAVAVVRGRWATGLAAVAAVLGALATTEALKFALPSPLWFGHGWRSWTWHPIGSFPSGHSVVVASVALAAMAVASDRWRWRLAGPLAAWLVITTTATLTMGWHRTSDVIGSLFLAAAWHRGLTAALEPRELRTTGRAAGHGPARRLVAGWPVAGRPVMGWPILWWTVAWWAVAATAILAVAAYGISNGTNPPWYGRWGPFGSTAGTGHWPEATYVVALVWIMLVGGALMVGEQASSENAMTEDAAGSVAGSVAGPTAGSAGGSVAGSAEAP